MNVPDVESKESFVSNTVYKLQLFVKEIDQSLQDTAQSVFNNVSKINREVFNFQNEASSLKNELDEVKYEMAQRETESEDGLKTLNEIDLIKKRLEKSIDNLRR